MAVAIGGGSAGVSIAGAGAGAGNDIVGYTKAYVHDTDVRAATDVTVSTNQTNIIRANVAAVAAAAGASVRQVLAWPWVVRLPLTTSVVRVD